MNPVKVGSRCSALAKVQSQQVISYLESQGIKSSLVEMDSEGDQDRKSPLYEIEAEGPGLFTKRLEKALLGNEIDLAVHSLKDLPTLQPQGLRVVAIPKREVSGDCLLIRNASLDPAAKWSLKKGALVGSSSLRREAEMLSERADLTLKPIRGNVPTRVQAVRDGKWDAVLLAQAGIARLGLALEGVTKVDLPENCFVPAPGQGALAIEAREDLASEVSLALSRYHHDTTAKEVGAEREILRELEGGCSLPLGVRCRLERNRWHVNAFLGVRGKEGWKAFRHFETETSTANDLVRQTVKYFREL